MQQHSNTSDPRLTNALARVHPLREHGRYVECAEIMYELQQALQSSYGSDHPNTLEASDKLCEFLNLAAMKHLEQDQFDTSLDYLRRAEGIIINSARSRATTFNNLACYYRRTGKLRAALSYLGQALTLEIKDDKPATLADTHLNICAVLSQLNRHDDAHQHAMLSIILIQDELLQTALNKLVKEEQSPIIADERLAVLAVAYHNLGVELEHLQRMDEAIKIYNKALRMTVDYIPSNKQLIRNLGRIVNSVTHEQHQNNSSRLQPELKTRDIREINVESRYTPSSKAGHSTRFAMRNRSSVDSDNVLNRFTQGSSFVDSSFSRNQISGTTAKPSSNYRIYKSKVGSSQLSEERKRSLVGRVAEVKTQRDSAKPQQNCIIQPE